MIITDFIKNTLQQHYNFTEFDLKIDPQSGGDTHQSFVLTLDFHQTNNTPPTPEHLFAKVNAGSGSKVLKSEFESLKTINSIFPNHYPFPILYKQADDQALLVMSFHTISTITNNNAADAGRALASQHKTSNAKFGWSSSNHIGLTPQSNQWDKNWCRFFSEQRLKPMMRRAKKLGLPDSISQKVNQLIPKLDSLLSHNIQPSLVHGDLWSGNLGFDLKSQQVLFYDPAPYFGDREVDLAMTELFGRQADSFYLAYQQEWPLSTGYEQRRGIYNLYHALNHTILFGTSYHALVENCLDQI